MILNEVLQGNLLFKDLTDQERKDLLTTFPLRIRSYEAGQMVQQQGDSCRQLILVVRGVLVASMQHPDGKSIIVESLEAPQAAASAIVFSDRGTLPVTLTAQTNVDLVFISQEKLLLIFQKYKSVLVRYLSDMGNKVCFLADKIRYLQMKSLRQKLAAYIRDLQLKQKSSMVLFDQSMEIMAEMFGVARPSLSRELGQLIDQGYLIRDGKKIGSTNPTLFMSLLRDDEETRS